MYFCLNRGTTGGGLPLDEFVDLAAAAGFAGADVDLGYALQHGAAKLRDLYAAKKMRFGGWGPSDWRGEAAKAQENLATLRKLAPIAAELGVDSASTWIMPSSDLPFMENWRFHVERLKPVAAALAEHGRRFGLEFVAPCHLRRKFRHEFIFTPGQMLELADAVGANVGLLVDCFHCHAAGIDVASLRDLPASRIVLVHVNDAPAMPIHAIQDGERLLPGDGVIDLRGFCDAVRATGYAGPASLEVFNAGLRALPPAEAAAKAGKSLARLA